MILDVYRGRKTTTTQQQIDLDLFCGKVKFCPLVFCMEKVEKCIFLLLMCSLIFKCIQIQPLWNSRGQGHLVNLDNGDLGQR